MMLKLAAIAPLLLALAACGGDKPADAAADAGSTPAAAVRASGDPTGDQQELGDYVLNMEDVRKWAQVMQSGKKLKEEENQDASGGPDDDSVDAMEARINADPEVRAEIEKAGLDARDFVLITFTLTQAAFAQYAVEQGASADSVAAQTGINPANLAFVRDHKQELEALQPIKR